MNARRELDELLEALCENRATPEQCARLEALALADRDALQHYLRYIELHGLLHWDAAGGEASRVAAANVVPVEATARRRPVRTAACVAAAAVLLLSGWIGFQGGLFAPEGEQQPQLAETDPPQDVRTQPAAPSPGPGANTIVRLPPRTPSPRENADPVAEEGIAAATPSGAGADEGVNRSSETVVEVLNRRIAGYWKDHEVSPSPRAGDEAWLRRVHLDLAGRIPEAEAVVKFAADTRPDKRARVVDDLLASPEFARHYASVWTNLLIGHVSPREVNRPALAKFLREQFHRNRPWSETVTRLISADGFEDEDGATNFLLAHLNNEAVPATAVTSRVLLCEQIQCTQCHNHPTGDWGQDRFWRLNAFFQQTDIVRHRRVDEETGRRLRDRLELVSRTVGGPTYYEDRQSKVNVAYPEFGGVEVDPAREVDRRDELARILASGDRPQIARAFVNRLWAKFFGYGFTNPVDDMGPHNAAAMPEVLDRLTEEFVRSGYDVKQLVRWICLSEPYQLSSEPGEGNGVDQPELGDPPLFSRMYVKPMSAEQLFDSLLVATQADQAGTHYWDEAERRRQEWLEQFYQALDNDENGEEDSFQGSLSQTLVMMNGDLIKQATSPQAGTVLGQILAAPGDDEEKIRLLSLATLSREPTAEELSALRRMIRQQVQARGRELGVPAAQQEALKDLMWAYLNSSEFRSNS